MKLGIGTKMSFLGLVTRLPSQLLVCFPWILLKAHMVAEAWRLDSRHWYKVSVQGTMDTANVTLRKTHSFQILGRFHGSLM